MSARPDELVEQASLLVDIFRRAYNDPLYFVIAVLNRKPRKWQHRLFAQVRDRRMAGERHTRVHVRSAHFGGKTWAAAALVLWWQSTRPGARTLTTAQNWRDIEQLLWPEIRSLWAGSLLGAYGLGEMQQTTWKTGETGNPPDPLWFATGASSDRPENLEGQHSNTAAMRVIDEAKAVDDAVFIATEGLLAAPQSLDLWISTPSIRSGRFYERDVNMGSELIRAVVTIDDLIEDEVPGAAEWKQTALVEYGGADSFEYQSRAMAAYIDNAEGALVPFSWIERAMRQPRFGLTTRPILGYDVAGSLAGDENALAVLRGPDHLGRFEVGEIEHWHELDTQVSMHRVIEAAHRHQAIIVRADVQGLGKGVMDAIRAKVVEMNRPVSVAEYRAADPARDPERFLNRKAEDAWGFRQAMEHDLVRLPNAPTLRKQLSEMRYEIRNGKIRLIDPEDSPDWFDALLIAIGSSYVRITREDIRLGIADAPWAEKGEGSGWGLA